MAGHGTSDSRSGILGSADSQDVFDDSGSGSGIGLRCFEDPLEEAKVAAQAAHEIGAQVIL